MSQGHANKIIWVDLTDMLVWKGHYTGIQRVTFEYARRFEQEGAHFCAFDKIQNRFFELDLSYIQSLQEADGDTRSAIARMPLRRKIRNTLGKPYYSLNDNGKAFLRPAVDMANFYVRYGISKLPTNHKKNASPFRDMPSADFSEGDTVFLLGASWNDQSIIDKLIEEKAYKKFRVVQHINDLLPIYQPQLFSDELPGIFRTYVDKVIHHADVITVISQATKRDVMAYCKENGLMLPIKVVRLGEDVNATKPLRPKTVSTKVPFILSVGTFEVRKNYMLLYQAVKLAQLEGQPIPKIIIAGRKGWLTHDLQHTLLTDPYAREQITWLDDVSDNELNWLYANCMFVVFPSLAEGWGLPIAEALHHGKMVVASGVSSMLEIGDGYVDYFLPYDARECLEKIRYYVAENRYDTVNNEVEKLYKGFTWDESFSLLKQAAGI